MTYRYVKSAATALLVLATVAMALAAGLYQLLKWMVRLIG